MCFLCKHTKWLNLGKDGTQHFHNQDFEHLKISGTKMIEIHIFTKIKD